MRYAPTFIWQYIMPLSLVLSGLTLGVVLPKVNVDDPLRTLTLDKSSPSHNITLFWAQWNNEILNSYWEVIHNSTILHLSYIHISPVGNFT